MNVAQINGSTWAISARGFNQQFSNKLLVMIDGRVVYTSTFAGVFWDTVLDFPLEDIARIEVIRGPGGTVWGANAVDGVINILTKKASETRGGLVVAEGGNIDQEGGMVQYGGEVKQGTDYRSTQSILTGRICWTSTARMARTAGTNCAADSGWTAPCRRKTP